jgi:hypothetical protein
MTEEWVLKWMNETWTNVYWSLEKGILIGTESRHSNYHNNTRWFKYDRDKLWLVYTQIVPVIFEPPCNINDWVVTEIEFVEAVLFRKVTLKHEITSYLFVDWWETLPVFAQSEMLQGTLCCKEHKILSSRDETQLGPGENDCVSAHCCT